MARKFLGELQEYAFVRSTSIVEKDFGDTSVCPRSELGAKGVVVFELTVVVKQVDVAEDTGRMLVQRGDGGRPRFERRWCAKPTRVGVEHDDARAFGLLAALGEVDGLRDT